MVESLTRCVNRNLACARLSVDISIHFPHHLTSLGQAIRKQPNIITQKDFKSSIHSPVKSYKYSSQLSATNFVCNNFFYLLNLVRFVPSLISRMVWNRFIYQVFFAFKNSAFGNLLLCPDIQHPCWETD